MKHYKSLFAAITVLLLLCHPVCAAKPEIHSAKPPLKQHKRTETQTPHIAAGILPTHLYIPALQIDTQVVPVGVLPNGQMGVPDNYNHAGILVPWTQPGQNGNAVLSGHVDHRTGAAVFFYLKELKPGDQVIVADNTGKQLTFSVTSVEAFKTEEAPLQRIFGPAAAPHLNLITCTGRYDRATNQHEKRLVVFTELVK